MPPTQRNMELSFGAAGGRMDLNRQMEPIWNDFEAWIQRPPFQYSAIRFAAYAYGVDGAAGAMLIIPGHPEHRNADAIRIAVDADRFLALNQAQQRLTLLHECMHLRSFLGQCRRTYETKIDLLIRNGVWQGPNAPPNPPDEFDVAKARLGCLIADQLLEYDAELLLASLASEHRTARAEYFLAMRRDAIADRRWTNARAVLQPYALLLEWLRVDLGEAISTSAQMTLDLVALREPLEDLLEDYADDQNRLTALRALVRATTLPSDFQRTAHTTYEAVVNELLALQQ